MKGDFTRSTFDGKKHYNGIRMQQGRVLLDAEWNEQSDIGHHLDRTTREDVIGRCGAPLHEAGFEISVDGTDEVIIGPGRYYVDGILCENEAPVAIDEQTDLPGYALPMTDADTDNNGIYLAYLDVWDRHVTALEDSALREVALGGPDTTTRTQTLRQVKLLRAGAVGDPINCLSAPAAWLEVIAPSTGTLCARTEPEEDTGEPCIVPAQAGYRGLENQMYRVEIHRVGPGNELGLKWSRENGSVVFAWKKQNGDELILASVGRDEVLGLAAEDWIELTDDDRELRGEAGLLVRVLSINGLVVTIDPDGQTIDLANDFGAYPKVRRWDMPDGEIAYTPADPEHFIALEHGVQVALKPGTFRVGDYWHFPARTATANIEWPRDETGESVCQTPHGIAHHFCRLALLSYDGAAWSLLDDCRSFFPPLNEQTHFDYVSGDGHEAMPGDPLAHPLEVAVFIGHTPVEFEPIRFRLTDGANGVLAAGAVSGSDIIVETGPDGIASCQWTPDPNLALPHQTAEATWLDSAGDALDHPIRFCANLSIASEVAYDAGSCLSEAETVAEALDQLCGNIALEYAGGQGQEVMPLPDDPDSRILAFPIVIRVGNGQWPAPGRKVIFAVGDASGELLEEPGFDTDGAPGPEIIVVTNEEGLAACRWRLAEKPTHQQVKVALEGDEHTMVLMFNASLNVAYDVGYTPGADCAVLKGVTTVQEALEQLCLNGGGGGAPEPGIAIERLNLSVDGRPLAVDSSIFFNDLEAGFSIAFDNFIDPLTVNFEPGNPEFRRGRATCFVSLEMPRVEGDAAPFLAGYDVVVMPAESISVDGTFLFWKPSPAALSWVASEIKRLSEVLGQDVQILARLTLKGNFIWAPNAPELYVDGETLGDTVEDGLALPSGDGKRGGDFETWFWLTDG